MTVTAIQTKFFPRRATRVKRMALGFVDRAQNLYGGTIECQPTVMPNEFEEICDGLDMIVTALLTEYFQNKVRTVTQVFSVFVRPAGSFVPTVT